MSKELRNEKFRQGFADGLLGMEFNDPYRLAYEQGRLKGKAAMATPAGLKLRNTFDRLCGAEIFSTEHDYKIA
jgi:hypothetical protein